MIHAECEREEKEGPKLLMFPPSVVPVRSVAENCLVVICARCTLR